MVSLAKDNVNQQRENHTTNDTRYHKNGTVDSDDPKRTTRVDIVLYTTTCAGNAKVQSDTRRVKYLLKAKDVIYREIDLSEDPLARYRMLEQSDCRIEVPQIHVNGRFIGTAEEIQEQEDFGELDDLLRGADPTEVIERTKQAIADRLLLERENKSPIVVKRRTAVGHPIARDLGCAAHDGEQDGSIVEDDGDAHRACHMAENQG